MAWKRGKGKWEVQITYQGRYRNLGLFNDEEAAARPYDQEVARLWQNPVLNFLPDGSLNPARKRRAGKQILIPRCAPSAAAASSSSAAAAPSPAASSSSAAAAPSSASSSSSAALPDWGRRLVDSILAIPDDEDEDDDDDERKPAARAAPAAALPLPGVAYEAVGPPTPSGLYTPISAIFSRVVDPMGALQSYATFQFVDLELKADDDEERRAYATALRLLSKVRDGVSKTNSRGE